MMMSVIKILFCCSVCICSFNAFAQSEFEDVDRDQPGHLRYGTVTFIDGSVFKGLLQFFDESRIAIRDKDGNSNFFGPSEVDQFEFYDSYYENQRKFVTLPYKAYAYSTPQTIFLEVLKESSCCFSVFMKIEREKQQSRDTRNPMLRVNRVDPHGFIPRSSRDRILAQSNKTVVLMDQEGNLKPYLDITFTESQGLFMDRGKVGKNCLDKKLIKRLAGKHYKALLQFAKKNDISLYTAGGITSLAGHCEVLCAGGTVNDSSDSAR